MPRGRPGSVEPDEVTRLFREQILDNKFPNVNEIRRALGKGSYKVIGKIIMAYLKHMVIQDVSLMMKHRNNNRSNQK